jgi:hypothetical protein
VEDYRKLAAKRMYALRRRAWWYLVAFSVVIGLFGVGDVIAGITVDPGITVGLSGLTLTELQAESPAGYRLYDFASRAQGLVLVIVGVLLTVILLIPYRSGMRWAWYAMWTLPAWAFGVLGLYLAFGVDPRQPLPPPMVSGPLLGGLAVAVLLLDGRRFFRGQNEVKRPLEAT